MILDKKYIIAIVAVILAFFAGLFVGVTYLAPSFTKTQTTQTITEKQPIYIQGETVTNSKIAYVPGETVYVQTPVSTTEVTTPVSKETPGAVATKVDGTFNIGKPEFIYNVNGKVGKFGKTDDEQFIFDKGMLDLKQTSRITIQAEIPTIDLTRHHTVTVGTMYAGGKMKPAVGYTGKLGPIGAYQIVGSQNGGYAGVGVRF